MNILVHCVYFPPEVGGLESHVYHLCRAFVAKGHQVDVVTSRSRPGLPAREEMAGIAVWRTWFPARNPAGWVLHALASTPRTRSLAEEADVIHAQAFPSIVPGAAARSGRDTALVATLHTSHFLRRAESALWRPALGRLLAGPDHLFASSEEIADVAEGLARGLEVEALTNGVDTAVFRRVEGTLPPAEGPRIIVPRRLYAKNGVEYFVRAMPALVERLPGVEAVLVGDGPERERLEALAKELDVAARVQFLGARANEEMPGLLGSCDLAVVPSLMEATSVAALEAMSCELPVAASRVGGLPEIVDESVGTLFEPGDPADLAQRVAALLGDGDAGERGRRGRERVVAHWSNDRLAERHLEVYRALTARRRSSQGGNGSPRRPGTHSSEAGERG